VNSVDSVRAFLSDDANDRANRGRLEGMIEGDDVAGECDAGSPGSGGASPYLRRACHEQAQRVEWPSHLNLPLILAPTGFTLGSAVKALRAADTALNRYPTSV
jgi:hypothetical protein